MVLKVLVACVDCHASQVFQSKQFLLKEKMSYLQNYNAQSACKSLFQGPGEGTEPSCCPKRGSSIMSGSWSRRNGKMEHEIGRWFGVALVRMQLVRLNRSGWLSQKQGPD